MKNLILAAAFAGLALISCQNTPMNTVEAGSAPMVCAATGGECSTDMEACEEMGSCDMDAMSCEGMDAAECDMDAKSCDGMEAADCDMSAMDASECEMGAKEECCDSEEAN